MLTFQEVLVQKMRDLPREVPDIPAKTGALGTPSAGLSMELHFALLTFSLKSPGKGGGEIPSNAHLYKRKTDEIQMMRRRKFSQAWENTSPLHQKYYGVFVELGQWDFSPKDRLALKKRFRKALRMTHPDTNHSPDAHEQTKRLLEAFAFLNNQA